MNLAIISLVLFFIVKMIYGYWGDYASTYWSVVYYVANYFMIASVLRYVSMVSFTRTQRQFFTLGSVYFAVLLVANAVCLVNIDWYVTLISQVGKISTGFVVLCIGLIVINYLRIKSHDPKN
jgi:ACR3 family arsenite efflux pump ArsB